MAGCILGRNYDCNPASFGANSELAGTNKYSISLPGPLPTSTEAPPGVSIPTLAPSASSPPFGPPSRPTPCSPYPDCVTLRLLDRPLFCQPLDAACANSATQGLPRCTPFPEYVTQGSSGAPPICPPFGLSCIRTATQGLPACWPFPECATQGSPGHTPPCLPFDVTCTSSAAHGLPLCAPWPDCILPATSTQRQLPQDNLQIATLPPGAFSQLFQLQSRVFRWTPAKEFPSLISFS
jgi:hypothetical protein